jgi:hypothetical protein
MGLRRPHSISIPTMSFYEFLLRYWDTAEIRFAAADPDLV